VSIYSATIQPQQIRLAINLDRGVYMKLLITSAKPFLTISRLVQAKRDSRYQNNYRHSSNELKVRITNFTLVYKYFTVNQPQTYCQSTVVHPTHLHPCDKNMAVVKGILEGVACNTTGNNYSLSI